MAQEIGRELSLAPGTHVPGAVPVLASLFTLLFAALVGSAPLSAQGRCSCG